MTLTSSVLVPLAHSAHSLLRYHGNEYEILDYVQSNPVCVLSHSTQLRPVSSMTPSVTEVHSLLNMLGPARPGSLLTPSGQLVW
jgi:hypothetical protein